MAMEFSDKKGHRNTKRGYAVTMHFIWTNYALIFRYSNTLCSEGRNGTAIFNDDEQCSSDERLFRHPFLQTWGLSVGEFACILIFLPWNAYKNRKSKVEDETVKKPVKFNPLIFLPAAIMHCSSRGLAFLSLTFTTGMVCTICVI